MTSEAGLIPMEKMKTASASPKQMCVRCVMDTSVPGIEFDAQGECNFCKLHDKLDKAFPLTAAGEQKRQTMIETIRRKGHGKPFDCVLGVSGGRDSMYTLHLLKKIHGLRPLAVHFNDGFGNPVAGENMVKATRKLGVELRTITSDWRESKDLKIAFLKASTPDMEEGTDIGIATALYGQAAKENIPYIIIGQSFRTEGIAPLSWNYLDGKYLKSVHKQFGTVPLRPWKPADPGFNLDVREIAYYTLWRGIRTFPILYLTNYVRSEVDDLLKRELDWVYPGAHYYDDLYQSLMSFIYRTKFGIDRRLFNYSALVRSGQMLKQDALARLKEVYAIEDPKVIQLCIKRLGMTREELDALIALPPKTFRDYPNHYHLIRKARLIVKLLSWMHLLPGTAYDKYFHCGT